MAVVLVIFGTIYLFILVVDSGHSLGTKGKLDLRASSKRAFAVATWTFIILGIIFLVLLIGGLILG